MGLLTDIQTNAANEDVPVPSLLRQCTILSARLGHAPLREWVELESAGYPPGATLPPYRPKIQTLVLAELIGPGGMQASNAPVAPSALPDEWVEWRDRLFTYEVRQGVPEVLEMATSGENEVFVPWPPDVVATIGGSFFNGMTMVSARQVVSTAVFKAVISSIRDRVLRFALDIEAEDPSAGELGPINPELSQQVIGGVLNQTILGDGNVVNAANLAAGGDAFLNISTVEASLESLGIRGQDRADLLDAIAEEGLPENGVAGPRTDTWMDRLRNGAITIGTGISIQTAVALISEVIGL